MAKLVTDAVLKKNIEDILTELVNSTYQWEEYTDEEVGNLVELDPTQVAELSAVISDTQVAKNKVFSSFHTKELLQENIIEANKYADDLVANLANIKLDIVDALPDSSTVNKSTIYILKDSTGGTNNTLNVWSETTSSFVEVGKLSVSMDNYYTKTEVDTLLADKANADEVVTPDDIITDTTQATGTNVLAASTTVTELDKKFDKSGILSAVSATPSDEKVLSEKATKTELDKKVDKTSIATSISNTSTDDEVASAKAVNGIINKHQIIEYKCNVDDATDIANLGITDIATLTSLLDITKNLGVNKRLVIQVNSASKITLFNNGVIPINDAGLLIITFQSFRGTAYYTTDTGLMYISNTSNANNTKWTAWKQLCTQDEYGIKTYTDISQLGLSYPCAISDICRKMNVDSVIRFQVGDRTTTITDVPRNYGQLTIEKCGGYCLATYRGDLWSNYANPGDFYVGTMKNSDLTLPVKWKRVSTSSMEDVPKTNITLTDETNYKNSPSCDSFYVVKNGTCYVTLAIDCVTPSSDTFIVNLPPAYGVVRFSMSRVDGSMNGYVLSGGELKLSGGVANTRYYVVSFSYPVAES